MNDNQNIKFRLGVDLDGVIYNFEQEFKNYYSELKNIPITSLPSPKQWAFYEDYGLTTEEYYSIAGEAAIKSQIFTQGDVYPGAREGMRELCDLGLDIVIITAREMSTNPEHMDIIKSNTEEWLGKNDIPYHELIISNDKTKHNLGVLVDDNLSNIEAILLSGGVGFVWDQPWNRNNNFYSRIRNWNDFVFEMQYLQARVKDVLEKRGNQKVSDIH